MNASIAGGRSAYVLASLMMIAVCLFASTLLHHVPSGQPSVAHGSAVTVQAFGQQNPSSDGLPWGGPGDLASTVQRSVSPRFFSVMLNTGG
jgi:hypothetical protein